MSRIKSICIAAGAVACLVGDPSTISAQGVADVSRLVGGSKLVVHGRTSKVEYRMSQPGTNGQPAVPYTIVTVDVLDSARGTPPGRSITLRFIGGPDGRGGFVVASNVPVFQVGDEDILFVQDNGETTCPLVGCIDGRFRVLGGVVHDGRGSPVRAIRDDRILSEGAAPLELRRIRYPTPRFDDLLENPEAAALLRQSGLSIEEARRRYAAEAPASMEIVSAAGGDATQDNAGPGNSPRASQTREDGRGISTAMFLGSVGSAARSAVGQSGGTFRSTVPNALIAAPSGIARAPSAPPASRQAGPQATPSDLAEQRAQPKDDTTITLRKGR